VIVCSCHAVTDRTVRACIVRGDETPEEIGSKCGAGDDCGACKPVLRDLVEELGTPLAFPVAS
jgi:bacterioferritin-associated ferredoxin